MSKTSQAKPKSKTLIIAYVPVLHRAYQQLLQQYAGAELWLLPRSELLQIQELEYLKKDLRYLSENLVQQALLSWRLLSQVKVAKLAELQQLQPEQYQQIVVTNDDIGSLLAGRYLTQAKNIVTAPFFLRWDKNSIEQAQPVNGVEISKTEFEREVMRLAFAQMQRSADWWRQVGALIFKDGEILLTAYNQHLPVADQAYRLGDPRSHYQSGEGIEFASSIHAEAALIAQAAKKGLSLAGASVYATTFPCPICAKQLAVSGISRLYYATGYAVLDGLEILRTAGVEVIQVQFSPEELLALRREQSQFSQAKECYVLD